MKKTQDWHHSRIGSVILWLGSIQLAVPVLILVAIGLGVGTYLESAKDVRIAREYVYGSWWFIGVMALMCVSLIFAVVARYPWKKRHIGFMTVHAGLVALIVAGFWSMFERVEGHLALQEGTMSDVIETADEQLELLAHTTGEFESQASAPAPRGPAMLALEGVQVQVLERWENAREEEFVADDSPVPLRAVDIAPVAGPQSAWVGQEDQAGPAPTLLGLRVLVLPEGSAWEPPASPQATSGQFVFVIGTERFPLSQVGDEVLPGWKVVDLKRFARALVAGDGILEGPASSAPNPAVQVTITDAKGTTELHTAFENFPEMVMGKRIAGEGNSAARLVPGSTTLGPELLVVYGTVAATKIGYVGADGRGTTVTPEPAYPMSLHLGSREVTIHQQLARAHASSRVVKAPLSKENHPALLVRVGSSTELQTLAWKGMTQVTTADNRTLVLHFGPRRVQLPFSVRLAQFKKTDYPGTEMAMSYQSEVGISAPGQAEAPFEIYMNHPYVHGPWKVYQSGFMGDDLSVFSVMHDPGLIPTYVASVVLCLGVLITFYSRSLSWGHPGIPIRPDEKEPSHASPSVVRPAVVPAAVPEPAGSA